MRTTTRPARQEVEAIVEHIKKSGH